jgi:predicted permease
MSAAQKKSRWSLLLSSSLGRQRLEAEMDEEIGFHLEARTAELMAEGLPEPEARRRARIEFGGMETHKDGMRSAFGLRWWDELVSDLKYAGRMLRKSPGFTVVAVTSLALAIGANTTIFSVANEMLYERLSVPKPRELRVLYAVGQDPTVIHSNWGSNWAENGIEKHDSFAFPIYRELAKDQRSGVALFAFKDLYSGNVTANGQAQSVDLQLVSGNFYSGMEITPQLGRPILPSDDAIPGAGAVALLSDGFWHRAFGGSRDVVGRTIRVDDQVVTIIGVNPPGFTGAQSVQTSPAVFLPLSMVTRFASGFRDDLIASSNIWWVNLMTRVPPGVSQQTANAALSATLHAAVRASMPIKAGEHIPNVSLEDGSRGLNFSARELRKPLHVLLALSGLVLLLACANIANLMLARASVRQREMSVRLALGASRGRILRQVLTESLLLSFLGGLLGLVLGYCGRNLLPELMQVGAEPQELNVPFNWVVFSFAAAITLLTGLLFGILPAWRATREQVSSGLKETARSATRRRSTWSGKVLVGLQVALSTLLVASSALFLRTLMNLNRIDPGFRADGLLTFRLDLPAARYPKEKAIIMNQRLEDALGAAPGVTGVTLINPPFLSGSEWNNDFEIEGEAPGQFKPDDMSRYPWLMNVGRNFFPVTGIRILRGRGFGSQDTATSPAVSVINEAAARKFFPHSDPIGRRFRDDTDEDHVKHYRTIIGVCADTRYDSMRRPIEPIHFDLYVTQKEFLGGTFLVRSDRDSDALAADLNRVIRTIDPDLPMTAVRTQRKQIDVNLRQERLFATLSCGFGILALLLASVGVYGIMAYTVTQRTNEIGIRLALGAERGQVRGMVLREAMALAVVGVVTGMALVLLLVRLVQSMLYGLQGRDPGSLVATAVLLGAVALVAGWVPAARASRVQPMEALRHE